MVIKKRGKLPWECTSWIWEGLKNLGTAKVIKISCIQLNQHFSFFTKTFQLIFLAVNCFKILSEGRWYLIFIHSSCSFHLYMVCF